MAGERKQQILEILAKMLEAPKHEKITTAALAARLEVSEAALYRHFASKAQMFEGLIEFIELSLFGLLNKISSEEEEGLKQVRRMLTVMLLFAEKNPGMTRVLIGDALVNEDDRLQARINQLYDRVESTLKQSLRIAEAQTGRTLEPEAQANLLLCFVIGRWQQFAKSGFKRKPMEFMQQQLSMLING
ncbi:nucleoid occlusion factor SlmA [Pseudomethylobacillus aquaticus]|uniref:Nucleoid occlusion factor SlmA n=1 Tax=Pseudomethylobacillus aquaticus TaxID=2676064 RepID=A0A3N0UUL6_9PROT|nr:nucleoid occlusion factor SlmA [Pseudomethylobacillus aquaticus]ROH84133.1 nucleoid occlusion factor SlmA [Pseudomethylobacillus aquaticus]